MVVAPNVAIHMGPRFCFLKTKPFRSANQGKNETIAGGREFRDWRIGKWKEFDSADVK